MPHIILHLRLRRTAILAIALCAAALTPVVATAADPIRIEQTFVPADRPGVWPGGREADWVPVERDRLTALLTAIRQRTSGFDHVPFDRADYQARFDPVTLRLVDGTAALTLTSSQPALLNHFVEFGPVSLNLSGVRWTGDDSPTARLGTDHLSRQQLFVPENVETLEVDWSLLGRRRVTGIGFDVALPSAVVSTLSLIVPGGWRVESDIGLVRDRETPDGNVVTIELGLQRRCRLRFIEPGSRSSDASAGAMTCTTASRLAVRTGRLSGECDLTFQHISPEATQLAVLLPAELDIESVEQSAGNVDWRIDDAKAAQLQRLLITLPDMHDRDRGYVVRYSQTLKSSRVTSVRLPDIENGVLLEGRLAVAVQEPSRIQSYSPTGLRQRSVSFDEGLHRIAFDQIRTAARLDLRIRPALRQQGQSLNVREVVVVDLLTDPPEFRAELELSPQRPGVFAVTSLVPKGCEITSVEHVAEEVPQRLTWAMLPDTASHRRMVVALPDGIPESGKRLQIRGQFPDGTLDGTTLPAVLPTGIRAASIAIAVLNDDSVRVRTDAATGLRVLQDSQLSDITEWSALLSPLFARTRNRWHMEYRTRPDDLASARVRVTPLDAQDGNAPEADDEDAPQPDGAEVVDVPEDSSTPVVVTRLDSQVNPGRTGRDHHIVSWRFLSECRGRTFACELPEGSHVLSVKWNGRSLPGTLDADRAIAVPEARPGDSLAVEYTLASGQVAVVGALDIPVPRADVLSVAFQCRLQTPREFEVFSSDGGRFVTDKSAGGLHWLFGPLARGRAQRPFNPLNPDEWQSMAGQARGNDLSLSDDEQSDWHEAQLAAGETPERLRLRVGNLQQLRGVAWFTLATSLLIGLLLRATAFPLRNRIGLVFIVAGGAMGTFLPQPLAEVIGAAVLGTCIATLIPRGLVRRPTVEESESMPSTVTLRRVPAGLLICVLVGSQALQARITEPVELPESISILVPYAGPGFRAEAISKLVYIRSATLDVLTSAARAASDDRPVSLIRNARWSGTVDSTDRVSLTLSLDISVLAETTDTFELPIATSLSPAGDAVRVNGEPASFLLTPDGRGIRIDLPGNDAAGSAADSETAAVPPDRWIDHVVEVDVQPRVRSEVDGQHLSVSGEAVAGTQLSLKFESPPAGVTSRGRDLLWAVDDSHTLNAATGPDPELTLSWANRILPESERPQPQIDMWSSVELHDRWLERRTLLTYSPGESPVSKVAWRLPPGSRISRPQIRGQQLSEVDIRESATGVLVTGELETPTTDEFSVVMDWRQFLVNATRRQSLEWPMPVAVGLSQMDLPPVRHLAGLTSESGLDLAPELVATAQPLVTGIDDYLDAWPVAEQPRRPRLAVRVDPDVALRPQTEPVPVQRDVRQSQSARVSRRVIEWSLAAEVDIRQGRAFVHRFEVPAAVQVETVTIQEEGVDRLSYWDQQGDLLTIHLRDQTTGIQNVVVQGRQEIPVGQEFAIPRIRVPDTDGETVESTLLVYRAPDVLPNVSIADDAAEVVADQFFTQRFPFNGDADQNATMTVEPIDTAPSLWSIARLKQDEAQLEIDVKLRLDSMQLPQATIHFPGWPFDGTPEVEVSGGDQAATAEFDPIESTVQISLKRSLPTDITLTMTARFLPAADPSVIELSPPSSEGLALAASLISTDACPFRLPDGEPPPADTLLEAGAYSLLDAETADAFLVWRAGDRFESSERVRPQPTLRPVVMHLIRSGLPDARVAVTQVLLQPAEDSGLEIRWPRGVRPRAVFRDGRRLADALLPGLAAGDGQAVVPSGNIKATRIPVSADGGPSLIEVLWEQAAPESALRIQRQSFRLPQVMPSAPDRTFLLAVPPSGISALRTSDDDKQAASRFRQVLTEWLPLLSETGSQAGQVGPRGTLVLWQYGQSLPLEADDPVDDFLSAMPASAQSAGPTDLTSGLLPLDHTRLLLAADTATTDGLWLVDGRMNRLFAHILAVLIAIPIVTVLFRLATFELLAGHPEISWLALGLVWWSCLAASGLGFAVAVVACVWMLIHYLRQPAA